jgi:hypothetical protein
MSDYRRARPLRAVEANLAQITGEKVAPAVVSDAVDTYIAVFHRGDLLRLELTSASGKNERVSATSGEGVLTTARAARADGSPAIVVVTSGGETKSMSASIMAVDEPLAPMIVRCQSILEGRERTELPITDPEGANSYLPIILKAEDWATLGFPRLIDEAAGTVFAVVGVWDTYVAPE